MDLSEEQRGEGENNVDDRLTKRRRINYSASPELYHNPSSTESTGLLELSSDSDTSISDNFSDSESSSDESARAQPQAGPAFQGLIEDSDTEDENENEVRAPDVAPPVESAIEDIRVIQEFIESIRNATLENGKLDGLTIQRLRNPIQVPVDIPDEEVRLSLDLYLAATNSSEDSYKATREAILRRYPDAVRFPLGLSA
ncbi:hypothetical protein C8R42DRAFT_645872 [Lentinula raphanica]|nr:hypothetical protein C8R42DRAFT_645872 [Lentinula raphanica]